MPIENDPAKTEAAAIEPAAKVEETESNAAPEAPGKTETVEDRLTGAAGEDSTADTPATDPIPPSTAPGKSNEGTEYREAVTAVDADASDELATLETKSAEGESEASVQEDAASDSAAAPPVAGPDTDTDTDTSEPIAAEVAEPPSDGPGVEPSTDTVEQNAGTPEDTAPQPSAEEPSAVDEPAIENGSVDEPVSPAAETVPAEPEVLTLAQVDSFELFLQLVREADGALKPFELPSGSSSRAALASAVDLAAFEDEIRTIAEADSKLASTLALLVIADRSALTGTPRRNVTALAARLLSRHPAFASDEVVEQRLSALVTGDAAPDTIPRLITRIRNLLEKPFEGQDTLKTPAARQSLQDNAVHTAVLIAASAAKWDVGMFIDELADNAWDAGDGFADVVAHREKLVALPKATRKMAGLIVEVGRDRLRSVVQERDSALTRVEISRAESQQLSEQLEAQRRRTAELEAELESVRAEHQAEATARRSERMGSTTDFETLRVDLARTISRQVESLEDALDALEHGQAQITKEFVGRSVNTLRVSLSSLQPRTAHDSQGETA
ncbi:hypothetical protein GS496_19910 [Rhodococcus hoagii]|nr:hypothetical protein [Prescottella equi]